MSKRMISALASAAMVAIGAGLPAEAAEAATVARGFDLLKTTEALVYFPDGMGGFTAADLMGVPFESFVFPPHPAPPPEYTPPYFGQAVSVGGLDKGADTIIHRLEAATAPVGGSATISIEMVGLQLKSKEEITLGGLTSIFYFTQSLTKKSAGNMTIFFDKEDSGTFSSELNIWFDIRTGGFDGMIVRDFNKVLRLDSAKWTRLVPYQVPGINYLLNTVDTTHDFAPAGIALHDSGDGFTHGVVVVVPEPGTWALLIAGFGLVGAASRRRREALSA